MTASSGGTTAFSADPLLDLPEVEGVKHRFVDADGLQVHVAEAGDVDAPPVLLLHGWPQHWYVWRGLVERLSAQFRLIAPDLRGFGWTEAPGHGYDSDTFAADQIALLDALEIESVRVIGHDWGGWTSFLLGIEHPERIERMVVCNSPHPWPRIEPGVLAESWRSWYALVNAAPVVGKWVSQSSRIATLLLGRGNVGNPFPEGFGVYLDQFRDPARADASMKLYRHYLRLFASGLRGGGGFRSKRLSVPTLLLFGAQDRYVSSRLLPGYEAHADHMELELVADSGHNIVDEKPDLVARRALAFLS
jgi:pimeloyl-ACP methyl ester carboxylesterase